MADIPLNHYRHLKRLADLRRCTLQEALAFLFRNVEPNEDNWIDRHWGATEEARQVEADGYTLGDLMARIQGLPRNIRPVTDGPYLETFEFFADQPGLLGIRAEGLIVQDFEMATARDEAVFALVRDLLPPMTITQYRIYNTFNSQCLRLIRQPKLFTMPAVHAAAIDAGCYVGYKALAMGHFVGGHQVLAFELAADNFEVLRRNAAANPGLNIVPIQAALSDRRVSMTVHTRNPRTMAHSLSDFGSLKEGNTGLLENGQRDRQTGDVETTLLDDYTGQFDRLSAVHISVNGHEPEVVLGGIATARKSEIMRISCPYKREGRPVRDIVVSHLQDSGVDVLGISGGAVIAGRDKADFHVQPL